MREKLPEQELQVKVPEGRHIAGPDAADKIDANFDKYRKSDKGKEAYKRYQNSDKGKEAKRRYFQSEKGKVAIKKWVESSKGQEYLADKKLQRQIFLRANKYQKQYPSWGAGKCLEQAEMELAAEYLSEEEL